MDATYIQYGALGLMTMASMTVAGILWRRLDDERRKRDEENKANAAKIEALMTTHRTEMTALLERIIEDGRVTEGVYRTLADRSTTAIEAISHRLDRGTTRKG
jgi:uncharacterized protein YpmS